MGGGGPKIESPKPGPYEQRLAKEMEKLWPYKEAMLKSYAWALPGAPGGAPAAPAAPTAPTAPVAPTAPADIWKRTFEITWPETPETPELTVTSTFEEWKERPYFQRFVSRYSGASPKELQKLLKIARGQVGFLTYAPEEVAAIEYLLAKKTAPSTTTTPTSPTAPAASVQVPSPTRPPTYLLAPYMESIEREYSKAREAISGMRPGGARERAMLELEAYWKPQAKATATRALYEEARAGLAGMVGEYAPTLRTLVGLEQQRGALEYQQRAAAAQASAAQQASMWQSLGGLASLGMMALFL